ncbi:MAG TPA: DNA polymerase Y family protein [Dokdonella sp.]|uniref:Y-family DNA polymerase n=1 Tax=Dokdonella sp. TaxID=2291710 RepID=UPI002D7F63EC|nr:DNA polymerase Y family protein [Dokdonella sp.]HET9033667.1 DNA polymerase Y family protein [Dokdonella sp.]
MLYATILLPDLAIDGAILDGLDASRAFVLIDGPLQRRHVVAASNAARAAGIHHGQSLAAAQALLRSLHAAPFDAEATARLRAAVASIAYAYSEQVAIRETDAVTLEIGASLRYFGGWPKLARSLRRQLRRLGLQHRLGVAATPLASLLAAADRDGRIIDDKGMRVLLRDTPLAGARLDARAVTMLEAMGLRRLDEVLALPRAGLRRRFGADLMDHLDRLVGQRADPLQPWRPAEQFSAGLELDAEVHATAAILFPLRRYLQQLAAFLSCRDGGVQRFELSLLHSRGEPTVLNVAMASPERDAQRLFELARLKLDRVEVASPIIGLRVRADELPPFVPLRGDLFERSATALNSWQALTDRLRARLGDEVLMTPIEQADHRPEKAWSAAPGARVGHIDCGPRPLWLLPRPIPLRDRAPRVLSGPERIESGWWDDDQAGRDYYVLETSLGQRAWAFREAGQQHGPWLLHGWFA